MQAHDAFLDRILDHETIDSDRSLLPHTVGATGGLILDRRVPPGIGDDDVISGGEIHSEGTRLQAEKKKISFAGLERPHGAGAIGRRRTAVEILIAEAQRVELLAQYAQVIDELTEDECLVTAGGEFLREFRKSVDLGA